MGRSAYWKRRYDSLASFALGDANRGAFLALQSAVSTRRRPVATDPPERRAFSFKRRLRSAPRARATVADGLVQRVLLASPRGYCAGVERAVETVERALPSMAHPSTCASRSSTTPTSSAISSGGARSSSRTRRTDPTGAIVVLSAHGVAPSVYERAAARQLTTIDATCPLVTKVHVQARSYAAEGYESS